MTTTTAVPPWLNIDLLLEESTMGDARAVADGVRAAATDGWAAASRSGRNGHPYVADVHGRRRTGGTGIKDHHPEIGVLVLSQHIETEHAVTLVALGGFGYLLKDRVLEVGEFLATAARVANGGSALDPQVVTSLVSPVAGGPLARLSERERAVLDLMAEGLTNVDIANRLVVSERTGRSTRPPHPLEARHPRERGRSPPSADRARLPSKHARPVVDETIA